MVEGRQSPPEVVVRSRPSGGELARDYLARCGHRFQDSDGDWLVAPMTEIAQHLGTTERVAKSLLTRMQRALGDEGPSSIGYETESGTCRGYVSVGYAREAALPGGGLDVRPGAFSQLRALAAELVIARTLWQDSKSHIAIVLGGRNRGIDVRCDEMTVDAKHLTPMTSSEKAEGPGCTYKLTRQDHKEFDQESVSHIGAVFGSEDMPVTVEFIGNDIVFRVDVSGQQVALIPTEQVNAHLSPDGVGARVAYLPDETLHGSLHTIEREEE